MFEDGGLRLSTSNTRDIALRHLRTWALELGNTDAAGLLQTTLDEEQATDLALTSIATSVVKQSAQ